MQPAELIDGSACPVDGYLLRVRANPEHVIYCPVCGRWWLWDADVDEWMLANGPVNPRSPDQEHHLG